MFSIGTFLLCFACFVRPVSSTCGTELLDIVATLTSQYYNVEMGIMKKAASASSTSPTFQSIVTRDFESDLCGLQRSANQLMSMYESCTDCAPRDPCTFKKTDLVIVLDDSPSVTADDFAIALKFIADLASELMTDNGDTVRMALVTFDVEGRLQFKLNDHIGDVAGVVEDVMDTVRGEGRNTRIDTGFEVARQEVLLEAEGLRTDAETNVLLLVNGKTQSPKLLATELMEWDTIDANRLVIGISDEVPQEEILSIATDPQESNIVNIEDFDGLDGILEQVVKLFCATCNPPCENGGLCVRLPNQCSCPIEYTGPQCQIKSPCADW